jgi:hypothetical protein
MRQARNQREMYADSASSLVAPAGLPDRPLTSHVQLFQENQVKSESTNLGSLYTMKPSSLGREVRDIGETSRQHISSMPLYTRGIIRHTFLPLCTSSDRLAELGQVVSPDTQDTSIPHGWQLPALNPVLDGTRSHFQQLGHFLRRVDPAYLGRFWQNRRLFPRWHTQPCLLKVVSLGRTSLNFTEKFCTH